LNKHKIEDNSFPTMLQLKMNEYKGHKMPHEEHTHTLGMEDIIERLFVMRKQEEKRYKCRDYLSDDSIIEFTSQANNQNMLSRRDSRGSKTARNNGVDKFCREQIVEWSFRVVDYFHMNREVVAIATSYLDRFLANYDCDRRTFKLAATTALYLAIKLNDAHKTDMMNVLSDLSRGEFVLRDIVRMETFMIETLSWLLNPPTSSCFVGHILKLVPKSTCSSYARKLSALATFFTELSLCDYDFTTTKPSTIAMAAVLNAIEILSLTDFSFNHQDNFLQQVSVVLDIECDSHELVECKQKLWAVYGRSEESALHENLEFISTYKSNKKSIQNSKSSSSNHTSPVCISRT